METHMDGGPFRGSRPVERRVPSRPQATVRQTEEPQSVPEAPKAHRASAPRAEGKKDNRWKRFMTPAVIVIVILLAIIGWMVWKNLPNGSAGINTKEYQAVFLTNGQVYFGKLTAFNGGYMKLTDVFYLQAKDAGGDVSNNSSNPQKTDTSSQNNVQLIKLGSEIHGPEDEMVLVKSQMLFFENLKSNSKVTQTIAQYKKQN